MPKISREHLEEELKRFARRVNDIKIGAYNLSCSVGASAAAAGRTADELYREADNALYTAKKHKRGMYVIEETDGNLRQNDAV